MDNVRTYVPTYTAEVYKDEAPFHGWKFYANSNQDIFANGRHRGQFTTETTFIHPKSRTFQNRRVEVDLENLLEDEWYDLRLVAILVMQQQGQPDPEGKDWQ